MVDTQGLLRAVVGVGAAFLSVAFIVILLGQLSLTPNLSADALSVVNNATTQIGSVVTTWGTIIILGIIVITVFIGILGAMMALSQLRGMGR